jgi:signal transduction histidine kinase
MSMNEQVDAALPVEPVPAASAAVAADAGAVVLAVDGRSGVRDALVAALQADGQRIIAAADAGAALDLVARERPDAALVHHVLLDGSARLIRDLRTLAPGLPVIVYGLPGAEATQGSVLWGLDVGVTAVDGGDAARLGELVACTMSAVRCLKGLRDEHELRRLAVTQLCHTLRAPLEVIQGYAELLRETPMEGEVQAVLDGLTSAVANARRLTRQHLAIAAADAPGLEVRCEPVELDPLIDDLRRLAARPIAGPRLRLVVSTPFRGAILHCDGDKLQALLAQLLTRAAECAPRGVLYLSVCPTTDGTRFELLDRAGGAPRGALSAAEALGDPLTGDGVGLALARRLASLLGATLGTRHGPSGGAIFTLQVPAMLTVRPADTDPHTVH